MRFNLPGLVADTRGVVVGRQLVARFSAIDRLVGFLRVLSAEQSIDDLQPGLRIVYARGSSFLAANAQKSQVATQTFVWLMCVFQTK